ncbi:MAG: Gfo/Idh/MocA family protein [Planctomycetaceae bacterium]
MNPETQNVSSRRDFLKKSSLAAVGAGLVDLSLASRAFAAGDDTIKVGLIGCGGRGSGAAVQALSTEGKVQLVAMCDAFDDVLQSSLTNIQKQFASQPERVSVPAERQFVGFDGYQKVIDSGVDLVILATPPGFRPIHFEAAVKAGKHVFMEKPVAVDGPGVRKVLEAVKVSIDKNLKVGVGLQRHHQQAYIETIDKIKSGEIGDIQALRVYWNQGGLWEPRRTRDQVKTEMEYQMRAWYYFTWLCGDHIVEQHIHNLDVGNWVKGAYPTLARGMGGREVRTEKRFGEIYDHHAVEYMYEDGSWMFSQCRQIPANWNSVTEHAIGTKGVADISASIIGKKIALNDVGSTTVKDVSWKYTGKKADPYQVEHDDLFAAIRNNVSFNEGANGAYSTLTAIMGRMATYSGKPVTWEQALNSQLDLMPEKFAWDANPKVMPSANGEYPIAVPGITRAV